VYMHVRLLVVLRHRRLWVERCGLVVERVLVLRGSPGPILRGDLLLVCFAACWCMEDGEENNMHSDIYLSLSAWCWLSCDSQSLLRFHAMVVWSVVVTLECLKLGTNVSCLAIHNG
jgi:hypothetical protein